MSGNPDPGGATVPVGDADTPDSLVLVEPGGGGFSGLPGDAVGFDRVG